MGEMRARSRSPVRSGSGKGGRGYEAREGDWTCPRCRCSNFARRIECFQCQTERKVDWRCKSCDFMNFAKRIECMQCKSPKNSNPDYYADSQYRSSVYARLDYREPSYEDDFSDEWICQTCGTSNYSHRERCFTCPSFRPRSRTRASRAGNSRTVSRRSHTPPPADAGDWVCRDCHTNNFRRKDKCFGCDKPKAEVCHITMRRGQRLMQSRDWGCKECDIVNFAKRLECFKCKKPKSEVEKNMTGMLKLGDWRCRECAITNFAKRTECFKCNLPRAECEQEYDKHGHFISKRDWICPSCSENNFAKRVECFKCKGPKPDEEVEEMEGTAENGAAAVGDGAGSSSDVVGSSDVVSDLISPEPTTDVVMCS